MPDRVKVEGDLFHGWIPGNAVYVGRAAPGLPPSKFANPFGLKRRFGRDHPLRPYLDAAVLEVTGIDPTYDIITPGTARVSVAAYRLWVRDQPGLLAAIRAELAGRDLACWCALPAEGEPDICHAAVLLEIANEGDADAV